MKIKNILKESIIKVPSTLLNDVNRYVASCAYYLYNLSLQRAVQRGDDQSEQQEIKSALAFLQSKGAKNIDEKTFNNLMNTVINLNIDYGQFFKELNYKNITPEMQEKASQYNTTLTMHTDSSKHAGTVSTFKDGSTISIEINFSRVNNARNLKLASRQLMDTVYHELQHVVQSLAIAIINPKDKQLQQQQGEEIDSEYYSSGIEFGPLLSNLVSSIKYELEMMYENDSLKNNKNKDIQNALSSALEKEQNTLQKNFIISLYQKDKEKYRKALKTLFKEVSPFYDKLSKDGINLEYSELPQEEIEAEINVPSTIYEKLKGIKTLKVTPYGETINNLSRIVAYNEEENWTVIIKVTHKLYNVGISEGETNQTTNNAPFDTYGIIDFVSLLSNRSYMDYDELEDAMDSCRKSGSETITSDTVSSLLELNSQTANAMGIPFDIISNDKFTLMNMTFEIEKVSDTKIALVSEEDAIFISMRPGQFNVLMYRIFVLIKMNKQDEALLAISSNISYNTAIKDLDKYQE